MRRSDPLVTTALAVALAAVSIALSGCFAPSGTGTSASETSPAAGTATPAVEATMSAEATGATAATPAVEPTVAPPATAKKVLPYKPGPNETGLNWAYLKKAYLSGGYVYVVVDYIQIGEGPDGWYIKNTNPKLRTFPLKKGCPCRYLVEGGATLSGAQSPAAFLAKWKAAASSKMIKHNPYKVTVKHGVVTKLDNEWLP